MLSSMASVADLAIANAVLAEQMGHRNPTSCPFTFPMICFSVKRLRLDRRTASEGLPRGTQI